MRERGGCVDFVGAIRVIALFPSQCMHKGEYKIRPSRTSKPGDQTLVGLPDGQYKALAGTVVWGPLIRSRTCEKERIIASGLFLLWCGLSNSAVVGRTRGLVGRTKDYDAPLIHCISRCSSNLETICPALPRRRMSLTFRDKADGSLLISITVAGGSLSFTVMGISAAG